MPDYQNGKIYKITGGGLTYIGSTTQPLSKRMTAHRKEYKKHKTTGHHKTLTSFQFLDFPDYVITSVEDYPCERKEQLFMRERYFIENMECVNKAIPYRSAEDTYKKRMDDSLKYRIEHPEKRSQICAKYYENDKEKISERCKVYYENNKDKIYERCKVYKENNKEKYAEWSKNYKKTSYTCECGSEFTNGHKSCHLKTKKHQSYITLKNEQEQQVCLPSQK